MERLCKIIHKREKALRNKEIKDKSFQTDFAKLADKKETIYLKNSAFETHVIKVFI